MHWDYSQLRFSAENGHKTTLIGDFELYKAINKVNNWRQIQGLSKLKVMDSKISCCGGWDMNKFGLYTN